MLAVFLTQKRNFSVRLLLKIRSLFRNDLSYCGPTMHVFEAAINAWEGRGYYTHNSLFLFCNLMNYYMYRIIFMITPPDPHSWGSHLGETLLACVCIQKHRGRTVLVIQSCPFRCWWPGARYSTDCPPSIDLHHLFASNEPPLSP